MIALYDAAERTFGGVDVSIQNAGIITIARIESMTEKEWDNVMEVNTKGVFLCCQEAISRMRKHKLGGRLINTASGQARQGFIYTPHYAASKFGVVGITQSLAKEVAKEGITVNAFCPGIIETDMWAYNDEVWGKLLGDYKPGELMAEWVRDIPMGRAGTGEDVAGLVTFLASDDAAYITGQTVNVDGGLIMSSESVRKHHVGLHSFRSMRRMEARRRNASALRLRHSQSFASRRQPSQAKVRSPIQRLGRTTKALA